MASAALQEKEGKSACSTNARAQRAGDTALPLTSARSTLTHGKQEPAGVALPREQGIAPFEEEGQSLPFD